MDYLSSHVLLVSNEARQKQIITMYNEVTADLPVDQRRVYNIDTTLPDETCEYLHISKALLMLFYARLVYMLLYKS